MKFIGGGKVINRSGWKLFKLLFQFIFILMKSEKLRRYGQRTCIFYVIFKIVKNLNFSAINAYFSGFSADAAYFKSPNLETFPWSDHKVE